MTHCALAVGSGGRFYKNANNLAPVLGEILDSTRHFYVLAFAPARSKGVGKIHNLKVKVNGAGSVSHRTAYVEAAPPARGTLAANLQAAETLVKGLSGGEIEVHGLALPYRLADGRPALHAVLEIDGPSLLDRGNGDQLPVEIYGYALDANGRIEDMASLSVALDLTKARDRIRQQGLMMQTTFAVEPGAHTLRFLVLDGEKHRSGSSVLEAIVPDFAAGETRLSPPIVMDEGNAWIPLRAAARSGAAFESPFNVEGDLFALRARPRLTNGKANRVFVLVFDGASAEAARQSEAAMHLTRDGAEVPLGPVELLQSVSNGGGYRRYVLGIIPQNVPLGDYRLVVSLMDVVSGMMQETERTVTVQ